ncbi:hypothetical protein L0Z72_10570 [candidate division KSB1 bacterium]|nr:hypothetical protein [candidate division KSB1 bacterium]
MENPRLWYAGGISGVLSICSYIVAIIYSWPDTQLGTSLSVVVVSAFPILGMISSYAICNFIAAEREGAANRIAFVFAIAGFTTLLAMLLVQLAVVSGLAEITRDLDAATAKVLSRALRMVDFGLDVAWDLLMSTALIFWGVALRRRSGFGPGWAFPSMAVGGLLIVLNVATFPWPPGSRGSFDIGPVAGIFILALNTRLAFLGRRALAGSARVS